MFDDNFFADFFSNMIKTSDAFKKDLDDYWQRGKVSEYYEVLYECKKQYKVLRNSDGIHKLEKR